VALSRERRSSSCGSSRFVIVVQLFVCHSLRLHRVAVVPL
jgi:hypothetical protein